MNMLSCDYFSVFGWSVCLMPYNRCLMNYQVLHFNRSETRVSIYLPILRNTLAILDKCISPLDLPNANYTKPTLKGTHCAGGKAERVPANE